MVNNSLVGSCLVKKVDEICYVGILLYMLLLLKLVK